MTTPAAPNVLPSAVTFRKVTVYPHQVEIDKVVQWVAESTGPTIFEYTIPIAHSISEDWIRATKVSGEVEVVAITQSVEKDHASEDHAHLKALQDEVNKTTMDWEKLNAMYQSRGAAADILDNSVESFLEPKSESLKSLVSAKADGVAMVNYIAQMLEESSMAKADAAEQAVQLKIDLQDALQQRSIAEQNLHKATAAHGQELAKKYKILIAVDVKVPGPASFSISYMTFAASWSASYDLHADMDSVELHYYANVQQTTFEHWNTQIELCTASPDQNTQPLILPRMVASIKETPPPGPPMARPHMSPQALPGAQVFGAARCCAVMDESEADAGFVMECMVGGQAPAAMAASFIAPDTWSVPPDGVEHRVTVASTVLKPEYIHYCFPESSTKAYRAARIVNDSDLLLLRSDKGSVFWNDSFVAHTEIQQAAPGESFALFFGPDSSIDVKQMTGKDVKGEQKSILVGSTKKETKFQGVTISNQHPIAVKMLVAFRVPESVDKSIVVTYDKVGSVEDHSANTDIEAACLLKKVAHSSKPVWFTNRNLGHMCALVLLEPQASKQIEFEYTITYPAQKKIKTVA